MSGARVGTAPPPTTPTTSPSTAFQAQAQGGGGGDADGAEIVAKEAQTLAETGQNGQVSAENIKKFQGVMADAQKTKSVAVNAFQNFQATAQTVQQAVLK
jgi:hypothetical protein